MLNTDEELKNTVSLRQSQQGEMRQVRRLARWSVTLAQIQVPPILSGAAAASRRLASPRSAPSSRVAPSISHAPPPEPLEASAAASNRPSRVDPSPSIPLGPEQQASILASIPLHDLEKLTAARQGVKESVAAMRSRGQAGVLELAGLSDSLDKIYESS